MMKRILSLALCLMMLLLLLPAQAETAAPQTLYRIVLRTEDGDVSLGTGVLFGSKTALLTTAACYAKGDLYAIGPDGEYPLRYRGEIAGSPLLLLGFAGESKAEPVSITQSGPLERYTLLGMDRTGQLVQQPVSAERRSLIDGHSAVLLSAQEGLLPGAVMLDAQGNVACMVVSQHGEGEGVYAALTNVALYALLVDDTVPCEAVSYTEAQPAAEIPLNSQPDDGLVHDFTASEENGVMTVDWTAGTGYTLTDSTEFTVYTVTGANPYLNYFSVTGETTVEIAVLPETELLLWITHSENGETEMVYPTYEPGSYLLVTTEPAEPFTLNGFTNVRCSLTPCAEVDTLTPADFLPQLPLTREVLADRDTPLYFQTEDTYSVTEESGDHPMLLALYTPEGYTFCYESSYIFMPEMVEGDLWLADVSELFASYEQFVDESARWPAGDYAFVYYIDGQVAGEIAFTLP